VVPVVRIVLKARTMKLRLDDPIIPEEPSVDKVITADSVVTLDHHEAMAELGEIVNLDRPYHVIAG
jgi:hypothetical protein